MSLLEVSNVRKTFDGFVAVDGISFDVRAGEVFGLLGPNGAGKSTTMMMIAGLIESDSGSFKLDGKELASNAQGGRIALGVVPQDLAIYPDLTAIENLKFFGRLYGIYGRELKSIVDIVLERTGLTSRAHSLVETYSGGMKRRLNFGIALLHQPRLLILDEPTVGVDPQSRSHLLDCIRDLSADGMSVIYASHYMEEVEAICSRVAIIDHGKLLACDELGVLLGRLSADICLHVSKPPSSHVERIQKLATIDTDSQGKTTIVISQDQNNENDPLNATLMQIIETIDDYGGTLHSVDTREPNLERLFLELTGNQLRD